MIHADDEARQSSDSLVQIPPARHALQRLVRRRYGTFRGLIRLVLANLEHTSGRLNAFLPQTSDLTSYQRLVFVCQGNICRSAYAEFRARAAGLPAASIGLSTSTGQGAFRLTHEAAARRGIDMTPHVATDIHDFDLRPGDLLLVMEIRQARKLGTMTLPNDVGIALLGHWTHPLRVHIHDPYELEPTYFDTCFGVIDGAIDRFAEAWRASRPTTASTE